MILAGAALLAYSVATGEMQVALVLIVPVIYGSSALGIMAIGLVIAGVLIFMVDPFLSANAENAEGLADETAQTKAAKKPEFGGVVLIGPIPIILGSSRGMAIFAVVVAVIVLVIMVLSLFYAGG
jgi:uncharacterized protein (TIGR00304 family)